MTGIPALMGSLKKNQSVVEELATSTQKELTIILNEIDRLLQLSAHLQEMWENKKATEEELNRELSSLEGELTAESREKTKLESVDSTQTKVIEEARAERERLQQEVSIAKKTLEDLEDQVRNIERTSRNNSSVITDLEAKLVAGDDQFTEKIQQLEEESSEAIMEAELLEAKFKALRYLLRENIITMPEAKVAAELKGKESTTIDHLQKTTFIGRFKVKEILIKMDEQKIVQFDKGSGEVKVLSAIDL